MIGAFAVALLIYLQQKRDEFRRKIRRDLRNLDASIIQLSALERLKLLEGHRQLESRPETVPQASMAVSENWDESPEGIFEEDVAELKEKFQEAEERENELPAPIPARSALYLPVSFSLEQLIRRLYQELPQPPGVRVSHEEEKRFPKIYFSQFFTDEFPQNKEEVKRWTQRYDKYVIEVAKVYQEVHHIISKIVMIKKESAEHQSEVLKELGRLGQQELFEEYQVPTRFQQGSLKRFQKLELGKAQYYEKIFDGFGKFKTEVNELEYKIEAFEDYKLSNSWKRFTYKGWLIYGGVAVLWIGIILPSIPLLPFIPTLPFHKFILLGIALVPLVAIALLSLWILYIGKHQ